MLKYICSFALILLLSPFQAIAQTGFDDLPDPTQPPQGVEDVNKVVDNTPDSIAKALMSRPAPGTTRQGNHPVLFLIGNSTMRNGTRGDGANGQWGWGFYASNFFDARKISVENQALGGMSTRTFYTDLWPAVRDALQPGDYVLVSIGHNDGGEFFDARRARAVIPGNDPDTLIVGFNNRTHRQDTVYSYGYYIRHYVSEIRARGAQPILMSLTPRDAFENGKVVRKPQSEWLAELSKELDVPYVDLNELSAAKLDSYSHWKEQYHFFGDKIHTSHYGATMNARSAAEGLMACQHPALDALKAMMINVVPDTWKVDRSQGRPAVFFTGDSTVKNADSDDNGMWGWAALASEVFDESKINLVNAARAGRSTRSFIREGLWDKVYNSLQPSDYVLIEFGHNDICSITDPKERGVIPGTRDTCHVYRMEKDGRYEVVYSFGWYLRKMIDDTRERGATPILVSLTPRNEWPTGRIERRNDSYGKWYQEVIDATGVAFLDLHNLSADELDKKFAVRRLPKNKEKAKARIAKIKERAGYYFKKDHTHASKAGALLNAESVARGLRAISSPLADYLR
ncbi:MAG: rhamnogalacturonan acetylesterase [Prevotella sp.]|nr:rhamnogalacturonan acetylesterase [Prevotella sp.]